MSARAFVHLALSNVAVIGIGWGVLPWVVPPYVRERLHVGTRAIGLLLAANAVTVVLAQVPIAQLAEGRRRAAMIARGRDRRRAACRGCQSIRRRQATLRRQNAGVSRTSTVNTSSRPASISALRNHRPPDGIAA